MKKFLKIFLFWLILAIVLYLTGLIGEESLNPCKWAAAHIDSPSDLNLPLRLLGMFLSICILTVFTWLIANISKDKVNEN